MSWASRYIEKLQAGETVKFRPRGNSMSGMIESGQQVTVEPVTEETELKKGDAVLCKAGGNVYLHKIAAVGVRRFQIANNKGKVNGWTGRKNVFGKVVKVED